LTKVASGSYLMFMRAVGLKVLKNKLSEYVRLAAGGETVLVTDRDRVVAELVPPQPGRSALLADAVLAEAVREGWLTPAVFARGAAPPPRNPAMTFRELMEELREDRDER
jgi:antitoxin (DNA-binding transcriptional repressor) of toxin-antitoxin stability system